MLKLRDWIKDLNPTFLCLNPNAISYLEEHPEKIKWFYLSSNKEAMPILEKNQDKIHWDILSKNPSAIRLLEKNQDKIDWDMLSSNPAAIHLLKACTRFHKKWLFKFKLYLDIGKE